MRFKVLLFAVLLSSVAFGQEEISWSGDFDKESNSAKITAQLEEGWHVYSMTVDEMAGPVSTKFELRENSKFEILGEIKEPRPISSYDENFEAELQYFEKTVTFEQELKINQSTAIIYTVTYMICNAEMCYPPVDEEITIKVEK